MEKEVGHISALDNSQIFSQDDLMTTKLSLGVTMRSLRPPRPAPRTVKKTAPSLVAERKSNTQTKKGKTVVEEEEIEAAVV